MRSRRNTACYRHSPAGWRTYTRRRTCVWLLASGLAFGPAYAAAAQTYHFGMPYMFLGKNAAQQLILACLTRSLVKCSTNSSFWVSFLGKMQHKQLILARSILSLLQCSTNSSFGMPYVFVDTLQQKQLILLTFTLFVVKCSTNSSFWYALYFSWLHAAQTAHLVCLMQFLVRCRSNCIKGMTRGSNRQRQRTRHTRRERRGRQRVIKTRRRRRGTGKRKRGRVAPGGGCRWKRPQRR